MSKLSTTDLINLVNSIKPDMMAGCSLFHNDHHEALYSAAIRELAKRLL
jgi:hypothetical protein